MSSNFYFPNTNPLKWPTGQFEANLIAIETLKAVGDGEATPEQQKLMADYVGWGKSSLVKRIQYDGVAGMTAEEHQSARASALNAHYTDLPIIKAIWDGMMHAGLAKLPKIDLLDPSAGPGHFVSCMPESLRSITKCAEVELDKLTGGMLAKIHPQSTVYIDGFENIAFPANWFDASTSNIPFGNYPVIDRGIKQNMLKSSIHDYFFAKSVGIVRPGGLIAYVTSRYTMDKYRHEFREWLASQCNLLAAVRLPKTAFTVNAGTEVVTDVIFLQKREQPLTKDDPLPDWVQTKQVRFKIDYYPHYRNVNVNSYFIDGSMILGNPAASGSMYGRGDAYTVEPFEDDGFVLADALASLLKMAIEPNVIKPRKEEAEVEVKQQKRTTIKLSPGRKLTRRGRLLLSLHDTAKLLLNGEMQGMPELEIAKLREELNKLYVEFRAYGTIASNVDALGEGAQEAAFVQALEVDGKPSDIFRRSTIKSLMVPEEMTPQEAFTYCLNTRGRVDMGHIATLLKTSKKKAAYALNGYVYELPATGQWVSVEEYCSGNVYRKLQEARAAASMNHDRYDRNVEALEAAQPTQLGPGDIRVELGTTWVPTDVYETFIMEMIGCNRDNLSIAHLRSLGQWKIKDDGGWYNRASLTTKWGTKRMNTFDLLNDIFNGKVPTVRDYWKEDGVTKSAINNSATLEAQAKAREIEDHFKMWLWKDANRASRLCKLYNSTINVFQTRKYSGAHLQFPGLNKDIELRKPQFDVVWRIMQDQTCLVGHEVGIGKTLSMIVSAMESKRLGLISKALFVVPNHLVGDWHLAVLWAYPQANVLCATKDTLNKNVRGTFMSKIATNEWDIVIVPFSSFKLLDVKYETMAAHIKEQIKELENHLYAAKAGKVDKLTVKQIEKAKKRFEAKLDKLSDMRKDRASIITFEELGIDYLGVDEFHAYKRLYFATKMGNIAGLPNGESERALDMYAKSQWLLAQGGKFIGLTGTPLTNTIAECFTMQRYFQLGTLKELGLDHFDAWAKQFARAEPGLEMKPDGSGFRMNVRFRKFINVAELAQLIGQFMDIRKVDLSSGVVRPDVYSDHMVKVTVEGGQRLRDYVKSLAKRAANLPKDKKEDNMLKITGDGRKAALDMSLVEPQDPGTPMPKIEALVANVLSIWEASKATKGTQVIFCDLATPKAKKKKKDDDTSSDESEQTGDEQQLVNNVYSIIKDKLVDAGIPIDEVKFIHEAKNVAQKVEMFEDVRSGKIRVFMGSTEKMGTGMNVQDRLIALHHLDAPWRPSDIEQRNGRIQRQGNMYPIVWEFVYITAGSFDGYIWQGLQVKASYINQIITGAIVGRETDDVSDQVLDYAEIKALASGNPKVIEKVTLDAQLIQLEYIYRSWRNGRLVTDNEVKDLELKIRFLTQHAAELKKAAEIAKAHPQEHFVIDIRKDATSDEFVMEEDREEAGKKLKILVLSVAKRRMDETHVATFRGLNLYTKLVGDTPKLYYIVDGIHKQISVLDAKNVGVAQSLAYFAQTGFADEAEKSLVRVEQHKETQESLQEGLTETWDKLDEFRRMQARSAQLEKELQSTEAEENIKKLESALGDIQEKANEVEDTSSDVQDALDALEEMHQDADLIAKFKKAEKRPVIISVDIIKPSNPGDLAAVGLDYQITRKEVTSKGKEVVAEQLGFF